MQPKTFLTEQQLIEESFRLGVSIYNSGFRPTFIVGLWRGGSAVGIYVQECLDYLGLRTDHIAIRTSYSGMSEYGDMINDPKNNIRVHGTQYLLETLTANDSLLIVDDVCGSGWTLATVKQRLEHRLRRNMPAEVRTAVVWNKPANNKSGTLPDFYNHETDQWLVLPYELDGLTDEEIRDHKPFVHGLLRAAEGGSPSSED